MQDLKVRKGQMVQKDLLEIPVQVELLDQRDHQDQNET